MSTAISIENLSKIYHLGSIGTGTFTNDLKVWWAKMRGKPNPLLKIGETDHGNRDGEELWALKDVSFTVEQGEVLGIIGRNGAGKSTLLKILSRVTAPTSGKIKVLGRIASLLEVGTGFHPELTGGENIYLNGAILGMTKQEVARKFDEIVDFAEVEKFIDTPVKRYSSGMYVRLAFAVAAHLEPEILVVDEVLAVGDITFQKKCLGKMGEVAQGGRTVLFVSHNMGMVNNLCDRAILLKGGQVQVDGDTGLVVSSYIDSFAGSGNSEFRALPDLNIPFQILEFYPCDIDGKIKTEFDLNEAIFLFVKYIVREPLVGSTLKIQIMKGGDILSVNFDTDNNKEIFSERKPGKYCAKAVIPSMFLKPGSYSANVFTGILKRGRMDAVEGVVKFDVVAITKDDTYSSFARGRAGLVMLPINWEVDEIELTQN